VVVALATPALCEEPRLRVTLPLVALPDNAALGGRAPSWSQALALSADTIELAHWAVWRTTQVIEEPYQLMARVLLTPAADLGLGVFLRTISWAHEEGHRATLATLGIASRNGINDLGHRWPRGLVPVYGMSDAELERAKATNNPAWVRAEAAGLETEVGRLLRIERDTFTHPELSRFNPATALIAKLNVFEYLNDCLNWDPSDAQLASDDANARLRDFAGPDCDGWVYDLFRPAEPYAARGPHPAGDGLRRSRRVSDLHAAEYNYLARQRTLTLLNLLDPNLVSWSRFEVTLFDAPAAWSALVTHQLTSFGTATDLNVFVQRRDSAAFVTLHAYANEERLYPGAELDLSHLPVPVLGGALAASFAVALWQQPAGQRFATRAGSWGGLAGFGVHLPARDWLEVTLRVQGKTGGWVALEPALARALSGSLEVGLLL
jgi:hypothetical protein